MPETGRASSPDVRHLDPIRILADRFRAAIIAAFPTLGDDPDSIEPLLGPSKRPDLGDFQSNAAMPLAKRLGQNPRQVAEQIIAHLDTRGLTDQVDKSAIAGPGFINVRLRSEALADLLARLDSPGLGLEPPAVRETIVVDLCGVNLAKQMHVGHLRSTVIGDAIARVLERLGHKVIRQSHVGDWGLPIAMVTARLQAEAESGRLNLDDLTLEDLDRHYREAQREATPDHPGLAAVRRFGLGPKAEAELEAQVSGAEEALTHARRTLLALQRHEPEALRVWRKIYDITMRACVEACSRLRANVTEEHAAGESSYAEELEGLVADVESRRVAEESDGALVIRVDGLTQPCIVRKRDGGYLYATTDLAAIRRRVQKLEADRVIYAVDARQALHFKQVFGAASLAGYTRRAGADREASLEHAAFGTVLGEDHRPFRTRSGENVRLTDLLEESVRRAEQVVGEKNPHLDTEERRAVAEAVGIAAIKYADLSNDRVKDYVFSFDRMLAFEGNTGPYLLYALVRVRSIFRRARERGLNTDVAAAPFVVGEPAEKALAMQLLRYPQIVRNVGRTLEPHRLCSYLFDLATAFSAFFDACHVLNAEEPMTRLSRLRLCDLTGRVLADGLDTLGLPTLERM